MNSHHFCMAGNIVAPNSLNLFQDLKILDVLYTWLKCLKISNINCLCNIVVHEMIPGTQKFLLRSWGKEFLGYD